MLPVSETIFLFGASIGGSSSMAAFSVRPVPIAMMSPSGARSRRSISAEAAFATPGWWSPSLGPSARLRPGRARSASGGGPRDRGIWRSDGRAGPSPALRKQPTPPDAAPIDGICRAWRRFRPAYCRRCSTASRPGRRRQGECRQYPCACSSRSSMADRGAGANPLACTFPHHCSRKPDDARAICHIFQRGRNRSARRSVRCRHNS